MIGTVIAAQFKKEEVKGRLKCVYCDGTGQIECGHCFGTSRLSYMDDSGAVVLGANCDNCEMTGNVVCINCQGSGLSVPDDFLQVLGDDDVGFTEEDYIGLFDETPIPRAPPAKMPVAPGAAPSEPVSSVASTSDVKPDDYTGGLG